MVPATGAVEVLADGDVWSLTRQVQGLRHTIGNRIDTVLSEDTTAIGKAMVVGDQSDITDETREVMAASGLAHIYSISGLHLSIVAGGIYWLLRLALASFPALVAWPNKQISASVGIVAAFLYLLLAGGVDNVPAFRSTLMLALIFGAVLAGRQALTMRNVAIAAIVIILIDPASIFRPSFQLSFAAVVGLIGIYELPRPHTSPSGGRLARIGGVIAATAWTSLVAGLATLLFSAYHFQQTAPLGVIGNVLALALCQPCHHALRGAVRSRYAPGRRRPMPDHYGVGYRPHGRCCRTGRGPGARAGPAIRCWPVGPWVWACLPWHGSLSLKPAGACSDRYWQCPSSLALGFETRPDILIADTTQAVAIRNGSDMALVTGRTGSLCGRCLE